jgi:hypothetical protein
VELIATELIKAQVTSAKIIKKRNIKVKYLTQQESLTIGEAIKALIALQERLEATQSNIILKAVYHCSACKSPEHNRRTCPALKEALENIIIV